MDMVPERPGYFDNYIAFCDEFGVRLEDQVYDVDGRQIEAAPQWLDPFCDVQQETINGDAGFVLEVVAVPWWDEDNPEAPTWVLAEGRPSTTDELVVHGEVYARHLIRRLRLFHEGSALFLEMRWDDAYRRTVAIHGLEFDHTKAELDRLWAALPHFQLLPNRGGRPRLEQDEYVIEKVRHGLRLKREHGYTNEKVAEHLDIPLDQWKRWQRRVKHLV